MRKVIYHEKKAANQGAIHQQEHSLSDNPALKVIHSKPRLTSPQFLHLLSLC